MVSLYENGRQCHHAKIFGMTFQRRKQIACFYPQQFKWREFIHPTHNLTLRCLAWHFREENKSHVFPTSDYSSHHKCPRTGFIYAIMRLWQWTMRTSLQISMGRVKQCWLPTSKTWEPRSLKARWPTYTHRRGAIAKGKIWNYEKGVCTNGVETNLFWWEWQIRESRKKKVERDSSSNGKEKGKKEKEKE